METIRSNVLVIGGGPSGSTAARQLALGGKKVVLLEKNLKFDKPCGGGIFIRAFDEFDLPKSLIVKEIKTIELVSPLNDILSVNISEYPLGIVHRQKFDSVLRDLAQQAGATLIHAKAQEITVGVNSIIVQAKSNDGSLLRIEADYLIAADGVNSLSRRKLLGEVPNRVLSYYIDLPKKQLDVCQFWFGEDISPGYYAWAFPHHNGINMGIIGNINKDRIHQFYDRLGTGISLPSSQLKTKGYYIPHWKPMTLYHDRVFYVGDSASLVLPFTYEGIYYAMKSGYLSAQAILSGDPKIYEKSWNALFLKKFRFLRLLQSIFLRNDWFTLQMVRLYNHKEFQKAVIGYWSGSREPSGFFVTLWKVIKALVFYREG